MHRDKIIEDDFKRIDKAYSFEALRGKRILITGAMGMLAYYYTCFLIYLNDTHDFGIRIFVLGRKKETLEKEFGQRKDVELCVQDVCEKIVLDDSVDVILHAAGRADPETFNKDPIGIIEANVIGTINVLELAREKNARLLFLSTREVYGEVDSDEISEYMIGRIDQTKVRSCYPESKRMAENIIVCYAHQYGIEYQIARLAHVYGPTMKIEGDGRVMADLIGRTIRREEIVLKSTGEALRAFCYVADAVAGLFLLTVSNNKNQIYNIANETEEISIRELAEKLAGYHCLNVVTKIEENVNAYTTFRRTKLNTGKIEEIGWKPMIGLDEGIKRTIEFYEKRK